MALLVLIAGLLIALPSGLFLVRPQPSRALAQRICSSSWRYAMALLRLLLGAALLAGAEAARHPELVAIIGWLLVITALLIVVVPASIGRRAAHIYNGLPLWVMRALFAVSLAVGLFLLSCALPS